MGSCILGDIYKTLIASDRENTATFKGYGVRLSLTIKVRLKSVCMGKFVLYTQSILTVENSKAHPTRLISTVGIFVD
jgi:hypothetical protein